jgi:hypothetical protein
VFWITHHGKMLKITHVLEELATSFFKIRELIPRIIIMNTDCPENFK